MKNPRSSSKYKNRWIKLCFCKKYILTLQRRKSIFLIMH